MQPLSAVLIVRDEERRLAPALDSLRFCDEVVVVDGGSQDGTCELARRAGARVVVNAPWPGFVPQRTFAVAQARHDWILALDADERVTQSLRAEIEGLRVAGFDRSGYRIPRVTRYLGCLLRGTDWYPDPQMRLFDRRRGSWQGGLVHESVRVDGPVGRLAGELLHESYESVSDHLRRIDRYTTLWAEQAHADGRRANVLAPAGAAAWAFLRNYVLRGGVLFGEAGFVVSVLNAHYTFVKLTKLRERSGRVS